MREIKFRAWDGETMWGYEFEDFYCDMSGLSFRETDYISYDQYVPKYNKSVLMQYTGLKDKNGQEIYEGDIVKSGSFVWEIKWKDNTDDIDCGMCGFSGQTVNPRDNWEVIGNIHENPELLK